VVENAIGPAKAAGGLSARLHGKQARASRIFAKGELTLFEQQADFRSAAPGFDNGLRYEYIQTAFSFDIPYSSITRVERYQAPAPLIKYFSFNWVRIIVDDPAAPNELLLSLTGSGTQMQHLNQLNDALFADLQAKAVR
jgi:hypothetical protein